MAKKKSPMELFKGVIRIADVVSNHRITRIHLENMQNDHVLGIIVSIPTEVADEYDLREGMSFT